MATTDFATIVDGYRGAITALYQKGSSQVAERGKGQVTLTEEATEHAQAVVEWSHRLGGAARERQAAGTPQERELAQLQLLASAAIDLEVAKDLAEGVENGRTTASVERSTSLPETLAALSPILAAKPADGIDGLVAHLRERAASPIDPGEASRQLVATAKQAADDMCDDAAAVAQSTLNNLLQLPLPEIETAANVALSEILTKLGDTVSKLLSRAVALLVGAIDKIMAAIGPDVQEEARKQAADWIKELQQGGALRTLLQRIYELERIKNDIETKVAGAPQGDPRRFNLAAQNAVDLATRFHKVTETLTFVLRGLSWARPWIMGLTPWGPLALTTGYVASIGCIVYVGGNYVEWFRTGDTKWLAVVTGLRTVIERELRA
jgi:hypothetical protein